MTSGTKRQSDVDTEGTACVMNRTSHPGGGDALHVAASTMQAPRPAIASILEDAAGCRGHAEASDEGSTWWNNFYFRWFTYLWTHEHHDKALDVSVEPHEEPENHHLPWAPSALKGFDLMHFGFKVCLYDERDDAGAQWLLSTRFLCNNADPSTGDDDCTPFNLPAPWR